MLVWRNFVHGYCASYADGNVLASNGDALRVYDSSGQWHGEDRGDAEILLDALSQVRK